MEYPDEGMDAIKATAKSDTDAVGRAAAYQALSRISQIYKLEGALKGLTPEQRFMRGRITSSLRLKNILCG